MREKFDVDKHLIDQVWEDKLKGLRKELISFSFSSIAKATELSKCLIKISDVHNSTPQKHKSNYLREENIEQEFWVEIGHAVTPVDCYLEEFLKQMLTNETSKCSIKTKSSEDVKFTIYLKKVEFGGFFCEQPAKKMFALAKHYKENGVIMFKSYPKFAHYYFSLAAKCLLSFHPFLQAVLTDSGLDTKDFEDLLQNIYLNIAACLIKEQRYNDTLHVLNYSTLQSEPSEKAVYRLALAYFHLKQFELAKNTIERIDFKNNKDMVQLLTKIRESWKVDHTEYSNMVKKMFA